MAYLFCNGSYAKNSEAYLNNALNYKGEATARAIWQFARSPGNTMHTYRYNANESPQYVYTLYRTKFNGGGTTQWHNYAYLTADQYPQSAGLGAYQKINTPDTTSRLFLETEYNIPYLVISVITLREWKQQNNNLVNYYTSSDEIYTISKLRLNNANQLLPTDGGIGAYGAYNTSSKQLSLRGVNPFLVTDFDDYLVITNITCFDDNKNMKEGIFNFLIRTRANNIYYYTFNGSKTEYHKSYTLFNYANFYSPNVVITSAVSKVSARSHIIGDYLHLDNYNNIISQNNRSFDLPFKPFILIPKSNKPDYLESGSTNAGYCVTNSQALYTFSNFESIQQWFIDWGIYAYQSQNDLTNDIFPDELKPDIGIDDNTDPDPIENLPDNKSDPIDLTPVGASPNDNYDLYVLHTQSFGDFRKAFLYTDVWKAIQAFFTNPIESILSIQFFPFDFLNHDQEHLQKSTSVQLINYDIPFIDCFKVLQGYNFYNFNLGNLFVQAYYGNYLDFQAKYELYIPYCGTKVLDSSLVVNHTIYLLLSLSPITGSGTVYVYNDEMKLITTMTGAFGTTLSISSNNMPSITTNAVLNALTNSMGIIMDPLSGTINTAKGLVQDTIMAEQHNFIKGQISGSSSIGGVTTPFIQVTLPVPTNPSSYDDFKGLNSQITATVGSFPSTSFVSFDEIRVNVPCTEAEKEMIYDLLKSGIYI